MKSQHLLRLPPNYSEHEAQALEFICSVLLTPGEQLKSSLRQPLLDLFYTVPVKHRDNPEQLIGRLTLALMLLSTLLRCEWQELARVEGFFDAVQEVIHGTPWNSWSGLAQLIARIERQAREGR